MRCSHDIIGSLYMESTCIEPPRIQPDGCGHLFPALTFAAFSQHAYLLLKLQQDRQEHRRDGVEVGRVAPGARMEAGLVHQLDERTPLIRLDAETGHALEVHYVAGHDCVASMAQGDRRREQVREADRLPSPSNRPRNPGGTARAPPFEREEVHLIQEVLDPLLLCGAAGVSQVLDAQVELERSDFGRPEGLLLFDRLDSRFRGWQAAKDVD